MITNEPQPNLGLLPPLAGEGGDGGSLELAAESPITTVERIRSAISILREHPLIGRKRDALRRELVISGGRSGYLAMYRYDPALDTAFVLRIRHQREAGFSD